MKLLNDIVVFWVLSEFYYLSYTCAMQLKLDLFLSYTFNIDCTHIGHYIQSGRNTGIKKTGP